MMFEFAVTSWCNYQCAYCLTTVHQRRPESQHAFDFHGADRWIKAFERVPYDFGLLCRGGEPFLDHEGFSVFLAGVGALPKLKYVRVDTNGSWDPARYDSVPADVRQWTHLNVSFHPTQITLERFDKRLGRILDAGWHIGMINYVMEAAQSGGYAEVRDHFQRTRGIYVNPNPDVFERGRNPGVDALLPARDLLHKTGHKTKGKDCWFPSISYALTPNGMAVRSCTVQGSLEPRMLDFIKDSARVKPLASHVACPLPACMCLDRYAFLEEAEQRGGKLNLLEEYVRDCTEHQARASQPSGGVARKALRALASVFVVGNKSS